MASKSPNQADQRRHSVCRDQHGRLWGGPVEMKTGHFCGPITPEGGWTAPLMPPSPYLTIPPKAELQIEINYTGWIQDLQSAHRDWRSHLRVFAQSMYGDAMAQQLDHPSPALLEQVGPKPFPLEPVVAASQGNRWILGLSSVDTKGVGKYLPKPDAVTGLDFRDDEGLSFGEAVDAPVVKDEWAELEEEMDPEAVGGKRIPVKHPRRGPKAAEV